MKLNLITILFLLTGIQAVAQPPVIQVYRRSAFGNNFRFEIEPTAFERRMNPGDASNYIPDEQVEKAFEIKGTPFSGKLKSPIILGVKLNPKLSDYNLAPIKLFSKSYPAFKITDQSSAMLIALGINKTNVANYRYRVVLNDSVEVIHWSPVKLAQVYGEKQPYGFIDKFSYPDKQVLVELVNVNDYSVRDGAVFDWRKSFKPYITNFLISAPPLSEADSLRGIKAPTPQFDNDHDKVTNMVSNLSFVQGAVGNIELSVKQHYGVPYDVKLVKKDGHGMTVVARAIDDNQKDEFNFNLHGLEAGAYAIVIQPVDSWNKRLEAQETYLDILVKPLPVIDRKIPVKQILIYLAAGLVVIGLLFWAYRKRTNLRLSKSARDKQNTNLKLRSIRAQLNPHFMFNALTSIQNLVNKNDMEGANNYLSRFANLTRKVLNTSESDMISLEDEIKILDDYLQMEQLRFNFKYDLKLANDIQAANIEVPAMLLQPFLENAVKHGVSNLREKGSIHLDITKIDNDLIFTITDNGPGFKHDAKLKSAGSFGLKLSEERIALLNEVYKDQPTKLNIRSGSDGTVVSIMLTNWIL